MKHRSLIYTLVGIIAVFLLVFFLAPEFTGYSVYNPQTYNLIEINQNFSNSTIIYPLSGTATSLLVKGSYSGSGKIQVTYSNGTTNYTIYSLDSTQLTNRITGFVVANRTGTVLVNDTNQTEEESEPVIEEVVEPEINNTPPELNETEEVLNETLSNETFVEPELNETEIPEINITPAINVTVNQTPELNLTTNVSINVTSNVTLNTSTNVSTNVTVNESIPEINIALPEVNVPPEETNITNETVEDVEEDLFDEIINFPSQGFIDYDCEETCDISPIKNGNIIVHVEGDIVFSLEAIAYKPYEFIEQTQNFVNASSVTNETFALNLSEYFKGTDVVFDIPYTELDITLVDNIAYIEGTEGSYELFFYAANEYEFLRSNTFTFIVQDKTSPVVLNTTKPEWLVSLLEQLPPGIALALNQTTLSYEELRPFLEELASKGSVRVILKNQELAERPGRAGVQGLPPQAQRALANAPGIEIAQLNSRGVAAQLAVEDFSNLLTQLEAGDIVFDTPMQTFIQESLTITATSQVHDLGYLGSGVNICLVDTGFNYNLFNLSVVSQTNIFDGSNNITDVHGHGTEVLSVLSSFAPEADYTLVKALADDGTGYASDIITGIETCVAQNADIISLSLGGGSFAGYCVEDELALAVNDAVNAGSIIFAATGNDGAELLPTPACAEKSIPIGASTKTDALASFTNYNNATLLLAPGESITVIGNDGSTSAQSGTSISTPMVAGVGALLQEQAIGVQGSVLNTSELERVLVQTGQVINATNRQFSRINSLNALQRNYTNNLSRGNVALSVQNMSVEIVSVAAISAPSISFDTTTPVYTEDIYGFCVGNHTSAIAYAFNWSVNGVETKSGFASLVSSGLSLGQFHSCGLLANGSASCWGSDDYGWLGNGATGGQKNAPILVSSSYEFAAIAVGTWHSCGLLVNGSAMCWGHNDLTGPYGGSGTGRLGISNLTTQTAPVFVNTSWTFSQMDAGLEETCAVLVNGSVACWGVDDQGQIGNGNGNDGPHYAPVLVNSSWEFVSVSAGNQHVCGLLVNGSVACWGDDAYGQLGDGGSATDKFSPVLVNSSWEFVSVTLGAESSCGLLVNGSVACWGRDTNGRLGDGGSNTNQQSPVLVNSSWKFAQIALDDASHVCGVLVNGSVACWGYNGNGQLGDGSTTERSSPVLVNSSERFVRVATGSFFTCGLLANQSFMCWGGNADRGVLGIGYAVGSPYYLSVPTLTSSSWDFSSGYFSLSGIRPYLSATWANVSIPALSKNELSLGDEVSLSCTLYSATENSSTTTTNATVGSPIDSPVVSLSTTTPAITDNIFAYCAADYTDPLAYEFSWTVDGTTVQEGFSYLPQSVVTSLAGACGLLVNGSVACWGGFNGENVTSPRVLNTSWKFTQLAAGTDHYCGVLVNGSVACWGSDSAGQLGNGATSGTQTTPTLVQSSYQFVSVTAGGSHSCGLLVNGSGLCWGSDSQGQLGYSASSANQQTPVFIDGGYNFSMLTAGASEETTCGVLVNGSGLCWGDDGPHGMLGDGLPVADQGTPVFINTTELFSSIDVGRQTVCGLTTTGKAYCWGSDNYAQIGNGAAYDSYSSPEAVSGSDNYTQISVGGFHVCAVRDDRRVLCWGNDGEGQNGDGASTGNNLVPTLVDSSEEFVAVDAGYVHTCGLLLNGSVMCWGDDNDYAELGDGDGYSTDAVSPALINGSFLFSAGQYNQVTGPKFYYPAQSLNITLPALSAEDLVAHAQVNLSCTVYSADLQSTTVVQTITVANSVPTTPTTLTPTSGNYNDTITLTCGGSTDADSDSLVYTIQGNHTGSWTTIVSNDVDGTYAWDISGLEANNVALRCYAYDTYDTSSTYSPAINFNMDKYNPRYSNLASNHTTQNGDVVHFNVTFTDLNLDTCIFEYYDGSSWANTTNSSCVSGQPWTVVKTMTGIRGDVINWSWWANDTFGNWNQTVYDNFTLDNAPPVLGTLSLTSSSATNRTAENLLLDVGTSTDGDGDGVTEIVDWRVDGTSLALVNMPFDTQPTTSGVDTILDYSSYANHGSPVDGSGYVIPGWSASGKIGGAIDLNSTVGVDLGTQDFFVGNAAQFTFSMWINIDRTGTEQVLIGGYDWCIGNREFYWYLSSTNKLSFIWWSTPTVNNFATYASTSSITNTSHWYHVMMTYDATQNMTDSVRMWIDGVEETLSYTTTGTPTEDGMNQSVEVGIGRNMDGLGNRACHPSGTDGLDGMIDEVLIFDRLLSDTQLSTLYTNQTAGNPLQFIASDETTVFENWSAVVTPNDAYDDGTSTTVSLYVENTPPTISSVTLASTSGGNFVFDNLSITNITASDADGHAIYNITDWRINDTSIAVLNMPFDTNVSVVTADAVLDYSTYLNHGQLGAGVSANAPAWTSSCQVGGCYDFDGTDVIIIPDNDSLDFASKSFSISVWANADNVNQENYAGFVTKDEAGGFGTFTLALDNTATDVLRFGFRNSSNGQQEVTTVSGIPKATWFHIVGTYDVTTRNLSLYIDGVLNATMTTEGVPKTVTSNVRIGGRTAGAYDFRGLLDEVLIFNRTLTPEQITQLYTDQSAGKHLETIVSQETLAEEMWSVEVTPTDSYDDGTSATSNEITVIDGECIAATDCGVSGYECLSNFCFANPGQFAIEDSSCTGDRVFIADKFGRIGITGGLSQSCSETPSNSSFIIQNSTGVNAWVDRDGSFCVGGTVSEEQTSFTMNGNDWVIQNGSADIVSMIDGATGNLLLRNQVIEYISTEGNIYVSPFVLDLYPGAEVAYSLRLLNSTYTGPLVQIRRDSDNATKDFYPDCNNELSMTSTDGAGTTLSSWIGSDDGYVATWYDQSGNANNATQSITSVQPQIVSSGIVITSSGKPALDVTADTDYMNISTVIGYDGGGFTAFAVTNTTDDGRFFSTQISSGLDYVNNGIAFSSSSFNINKNVPVAVKYSSVAGDGLTLVTALLKTSGSPTHFVYVDNVLAGTATHTISSFIPSAGSSSALFRNVWNYPSSGLGARVHEIIVYNSDESANRISIANEINDYYTIY